jgi:DNA-binding NtrC family response regulator
VTQAPFNKIRVLVVDDEPPLREILKNNLLVMGYKVTTAESGETALKKASETTFNVVVSDIRLGKMDGLELGRKLRERDSALALVFITGNPSSKGVTSAQSLRAIQYIAKPVSVDDLGENVAIAARWNVSQLISKVAQKYCGIRGENMSLLENKLQYVRAVVKNIVLSKLDAALLVEFAYAKNPQATALFALLDVKMAPYMRTV